MATITHPITPGTDAILITFMAPNLCTNGPFINENTVSASIDIVAEKYKLVLENISCSCEYFSLMLN